MHLRLDGKKFAACPLVQLTVVFATGILAARSFYVPVPPLLGAASITTLSTFAAVLRLKLKIAAMLMMLSMFLLGGALARIESKVLPNQVKRLIDEGVIKIGEPVEITGTLAREPEPAPERLYLHLQVERVRTREIRLEASGQVVLIAAAGKSHEAQPGKLDLRYGERIRVTTRLKRADDFRNPGVSPFTEYLDRKGYDASAFIKSPLHIERLGSGPTCVPLGWLYEWRGWLQREIQSHFSPDTAGVLNATLLGNRYFLSYQAAERFREGGTFHVLVISGLHITFLGSLVFLISRRFTKNRIAQFLLSVTLLWAYSFAVGAESSVVRAALMFSAVVAAPLVARRSNSLNALGGAALILLAWRPRDLFDPSFQLTFVSVLAIVCLAWPIFQKMSELGSWKPTRETPYPPSCAFWLRTFSECLFWKPKFEKTELQRTNHSYSLFKTHAAATLEHYHLQRPLRYVFGAIVVSLAVQTALAPFLVVYFHRLSIASVFLNIGISLLMAGVAMAATVGLVVAQVDPVTAAPFILLADNLNWLMVHSVDPFSRLNIASMRLPEYTGVASGIYVVYFIPLFMLLKALSSWAPLGLPGSRDECPGFFSNCLRYLRVVRCKSTQAKACTPNDSEITRLALAAQLLVIGLIVFHPFADARSDGKLRIDFLDVGQGDAALVTFPDDSTLLIDGGGRVGPFRSDRQNEGVERDTRSIGEAVVSEYLWWRGLDRVDYLLATHADADHIDGLRDVARNFLVRAVLVARAPARDMEYLKLSDTLVERRIPSRLIGAGDRLYLAGVQMNVLWPPSSASPNASSANDDSIVLRLQFGERTFLLTGDIEATAEKALIRNGEELQADVVKIAHHGSKTSSTQEFVNFTKPAFGVISVGRTSMFGHPSREVVERWEASGARVLTTGKSGTIIFSTDGRDLTLETFLKSE